MVSFLPHVVISLDFRSSVIIVVSSVIGVMDGTAAEIVADVVHIVLVVLIVFVIVVAVLVILIISVLVVVVVVIVAFILLVPVLVV